MIAHNINTLKDINCVFSKENKFENITKQL